MWVLVDILAQTASLLLPQTFVACALDSHCDSPIGWRIFGSPIGESLSVCTNPCRMSFMQYHAILDNGLRCQSCCNRCQLFGCRDPDSGWFGDCSECNIRWYRGQLSCVSRETKQMASGKNLWNFGVLATERIFRFAGLDVKFKRLGVVFTRKLRMLKSTLTNVVDSDDEFLMARNKLCRFTLWRY